MANVALAKKGNTKVESDGRMTKVELYSTTIVLFSNSTITLNSGGHKTATTKRRMNETSDEFNLGIHVYAKRGEWFVMSPDLEPIPFEDGIVIPR